MLQQSPNTIGVLITALYGSIALAAAVDPTDSFDVLEYVDPLIGTANGGAKIWSRLPLPQQLMSVCARPCISWSNLAFW
jgi:hypothetical protein